MKKTNAIAMLLAGGQGTRLEALTRENAKPGVMFGGKYRIIDFSLSNCFHSEIYTVGVMTQYKPLLLNRYISNGNAWALDKVNQVRIYSHRTCVKITLNGTAEQLMLSTKTLNLLRCMTQSMWSFYLGITFIK